jgi:hypothetical protein
MWNLEGLTVRGLYMGEYPVSGRVELSRVKYGGEVVHTVVLEKPLNLRWRAEPAERLLVEHKYIEQVGS